MKANVIAAMLCIATIFCSYANLVYGQERKLTGTEIESLCARAVVEITTTHYDDGGKEELGGSGFFVDEDAHVLTNAHVAKNEPDTWKSGPRAPTDKHKESGEYFYQVTLTYNLKGRKKFKKTFEAKLVGWDKYRDLAVLKVLGISRQEYDVLPIERTRELAAWETVYVTGFPFSVGKTATSGIVSALHVNRKINWLEDDIVTEAGIYPGNSGGPLVNEWGKVVGINYASMILVDIGYAIPVKFVDLDAMLAAGPSGVRYGYLGAETTPEDPFMRDGTGADLNRVESLHHAVRLARAQQWFLKITADHTAIATSVAGGSPAEKAGLRRGDIVWSWDGTDIPDTMALRMVQSTVKPGAATKLVVKRFEVGDLREQTIELTVTLEPEGR